MEKECILRVTPLQNQGMESANKNIYNIDKNVECQSAVMVSATAPTPSCSATYMCNLAVHQE